MSGPKHRPTPAPAADWRFPAFERDTLPNGLAVIACHLPDRPVIDVHLVLDGGIRREPASMAGIATITAHALLEGSELRPADDFNEALELLGARLGVHPAWNGIVPVLSAPRSQLLPALELFTELAMAPGFREDDVQRAIRRRADAISIENRMPQSAAMNGFAAAVFPEGSRMALPAAGDAAGVANVEPASVAAWWQEFAHPSESTLLIVGDLRGLDVPTLVAKTFGGWAADGPAAGPFPPEAYPSGRRGLVLDFPQAVQTNLVVGQAFAPVADDDRAAVQLAGHALGGYFASRLVTKLREEKSITYGATASVSNRVGVSILTMMTAVEAGATAEALAEIEAQVKSLAEDGFTDAEVRAAADNLVGRGPIAFKTTDAVASQLQSMVLHRLPDDYVDRQRARVAALTAAEVTDAFRRYVDPANLAVAAAGPAARISEAVDAVTTPAI